MNKDLGNSSGSNIKQIVYLILLNPYKMLILKWNWKSAFLSAVMRSSIFLITYLLNREGIKMAIGAMLTQFIIRTAFGGLNGAIIQSFSKVEPAWQSVLTVPLVLAAISHTVEYITQSIYDAYLKTNSGGKAITISVGISIVSAIFNLFAMRRGAILVKDENEQSLWTDLKRMPQITIDFIVFPFNWILRKLKA